MSEDCEDCGKTTYSVSGLCEECEKYYPYNWEEQEHFDNQAFYEYEGKIQLDKLEELPYKEKIR